MATLASTTTFESRYVVRSDAEAIEREVIDSAKPGLPGAPLTVWFVGEAHSSQFDVLRRQALVTRLADQPRVLLALERTFIKPGSIDNAVVENNDENSSSDARNRQIVAFVLDYIGSNPGVRTIVFLFGYQHVVPIQRHLLRQLPATATVNWVDCPDVDTAAGQRMAHQPAMFGVAGRKPVGYCEANESDHRLKLLERGHVVVPFNLDVFSAGVANMGIVGRAAYALFFKNTTFHDHQRKMIDKDGSGGVDIKRINGAYTVVLKPLAKTDIATAETGKLFS
jgi:hypothetical protein